MGVGVKEGVVQPQPFFEPGSSAVVEASPAASAPASNGSGPQPRMDCWTGQGGNALEAVPPSVHSVCVVDPGAHASGPLMSQK